MRIDSLACSGPPEDLKPGDMVFAVTHTGFRHAKIVEVDATTVKFLLPGAMGVQSMSRARVVRAKESRG